jgi:putative endonuclease
MPDPSGRQRLGTFGEGHARRHLEAKGYVFVKANWRRSSGEIDLVMLDGRYLVFVEVKTRRGDPAGRAEESISDAQAERLMAMAELYVEEHPETDGLIWRCDLVAVTLDASGRVRSVQHYPNAIVTG